MTGSIVPTAAKSLPLGQVRAGKSHSSTPMPQTNHWAILAVVTVGTFMTTLDASIVNIALPSMAQAFGTALTGAVEWVIIGYLVVIAALLLTVGRLADLIGRPPLWIAGLVIFTVGSAASGAAPSVVLLIAARALQGVGSACLLATGLAILSDAFSAGTRGRALGINTIALALGASAGPTLGGLIVEHLDWRWIFYVNVPVGILAVLASRRILPHAGPRHPGRFDVIGAVLHGVAIGGLNLGLSFGQGWGWGSVPLIATVVISVGALVAAVIHEQRTLAPLLDLTLFRNRVFASAVFSLVCAMLALFAVGFLLPFYFEELRGFSTQEAGLLLTPFSITIAVVGPVAGSLADRFGSRWLAPLGLALTVIGLLQLTRLSSTSSLPEMIVPLVINGVGQGLFLSPNSNSLLAATPPAEQGQASGVLATGRVVGQSLSVAVAGAVFANLGGAMAGMSLIGFRGRSAEPELVALQETFLSALHAAFLVCAGFAVLGFVATLLRGPEPAHRLAGGSSSISTAE
jgi:EmrB/QacA subfamily drug resistance transporter